MPRAQPSNSNNSLEVLTNDNVVNVLEDMQGARDFGDSALFDLGSGQHVPVTIWSDTANVPAPMDPVKAPQSL